LTVLKSVNILLRYLLFSFIFAVCLTLDITAATASSNVTNLNTNITISGWGEISLGISYKELQTVLSREYTWLRLEDDALQEFPGEQKRVLVKCVPNRYINDLHFQFHNGKLYLIRLLFAPEFFSYLKLYNKLKEKYGAAHEISYKRVSWYDDQKTLFLERDTSVRYIDRSVFPASNAVQTSTADKNNADYIKLILDSL